MHQHERRLQSPLCIDRTHLTRRPRGRSASNPTDHSSPLPFRPTPPHHLPPMRDWMPCTDRQQTYRRRPRQRKPRARSGVQMRPRRLQAPPQPLGRHRRQHGWQRPLLLPPPRRHLHPRCQRRSPGYARASSVSARWLRMGTRSARPRRTRGRWRCMPNTRGASSTWQK